MLDLMEMQYSILRILSADTLIHQFPFLCFSCKARTCRKGKPIYVLDLCFFLPGLSGWLRLTSVNCLMYLTKVKTKFLFFQIGLATYRHLWNIRPRLESLSCPLLLDQSVVHSVAFSCCRTCLWLFWNPFIRRIAVSWNWSRGYIIHFNSLASRTSAAK